MRCDGYEFMADSVTKFFNAIRVAGWFHHPDDELAGIAIVGDAVAGCVGRIGLAHDGVAGAAGPNKGFALQFLRPEEGFNQDAEIEFRTRKGWVRRVTLRELCAERIGLYPSLAMFDRFTAAVEAIPWARVLDIGGRDRSGHDRSRDFRFAEYVVLDILPGENVNVVADAHVLASHFPADHFDAIVSIAVFEHLMMPWTVVTQMNQVLKPGGIALINTHQTLGMHDMPWDYWRFSDMAWDALFNRRTGFEILERQLDIEQFIVPAVYRDDKADAEKACGYEVSAVLVRKVGPCELSWSVKPADLVSTGYPG